MPPGYDPEAWAFDMFDLFCAEQIQRMREAAGLA